MKRLLTFVSRLLFIVAVVAAVAVAFILLGILVVRVDDLATQVAALSTRVHGLEQGGAAQPGSGSQGGGPSRTPTRTPSPTPTGPTHTPGPTRTPTPTRTATFTPVPTPYFIVNSDWANVRKGPDPKYPIIDAIPRGEQHDIDARNPSGAWLEFCCVKGQRGWIYAPLVDVNVNVTVIPTVSATPTVSPSPTPTPTNTPTLTPGCDPHNPHGPDCDCGDFSTHRQAQAFFIAAGGPDSDPHRLDGNKNGLACERLP